MCGRLLQSLALEKKAVHQRLQLRIARLQGGLLARVLQTWKEWHADEVFFPLCWKGISRELSTASFHLAQQLAADA
jgi:hypothetical protein